MGIGIPQRPPPLRPPGTAKGPKFAALQLGAKALQSAAPLRGFDAYLVGFHPAKDSPDMQMEAHHYCKVVDDDLIQCVLFDGNTSEANLIGIEYIVSESLFDTLPEEERGYWHPHNYEILARDRARVLGLDPDATRERRQQLLDRAHPQHGVDALASEFSGTTPIPGVREAAPGHDREEAPDASPAPWPDRDG